MKTVTVKEMKEIEKNADASGLSYYQMMENAGSESYRIITEAYPHANALAVFCGKGNNGGDGLVVARLAANDGKKVSVVLVEGIPVTEDAKTNYDMLPETADVYDIGALVEKNGNALSDVDVIIDALYGTGFHGDLREKGRIACKMMNSALKPVVSLDIPSGCSADDAERCEDAVMAEITIAFHAYKNVHAGNISNCGKCRLANIGINEED